MPATEHGGNAGRAQGADVFWLRPQHLNGFFVLGVSGKAAHGLTNLIIKKGCGAFKIGACDLVGFDGEPVVFDALDGSSQVKNRVVGTGHGAVAADIFGGHRVGGVGLLCEPHHILNGLITVIQRTATAINDNGVLGINEIAMVVGEILHRVLQRLFIACKRNDEIAIRYKSLRF